MPHRGLLPDATMVGGASQGAGDDRIASGKREAAAEATKRPDCAKSGGLMCLRTKSREVEMDEDARCRILF